MVKIIDFSGNKSLITTSTKLLYIVNNLYNKQVKRKTVSIIATIAYVKLLDDLMTQYNTIDKSSTKCLNSLPIINN